MKTQPLRSTFRLLAGWCALLVYLCAFSPLGVGLAVLVGSLDPNHRAMLQMGTAGTRLVLHHSGICSTHHHGLAARTLLVFAEPVRSGQPDHVLQFCAADSFAKPTQCSAPAPATLSPPDFALTETILSPSYRDFFLPAAARAPSTESGSLAGLRSTVLLI